VLNVVEGKPVLKSLTSFYIKARDLQHVLKSWISLVENFILVAIPALNCHHTALYHYDENRRNQLLRNEKLLSSVNNLWALSGHPIRLLPRSGLNGITIWETIQEAQTRTRLSVVLYSLLLPCFALCEHNALNDTYNQILYTLL
jgi:hypothetical protein